MSTLGSIDLNELIQQLSDSADPVMYQYFKNLKNRTIVINEDISEASIETVVLPLLEMDNDGTSEKITIYLNTNGGDVFTGLLICDVIRKLKTKTEIILLSTALSMGALILMASFNNPKVTRKCYPFSIGLIHAGSISMGYTSAMQAKDYFNFNNKYEEKIKEYVLSHSKITEEEYDNMQRYEWYLTSQDLLDKGLIDEIL